MALSKEGLFFCQDAMIVCCRPVAFGTHLILFILELRRSCGLNLLTALVYHPLPCNLFFFLLTIIYFYQEMAAISAFMASQRPYPTHYMETSITTYLNACRYSLILHVTENSRKHGEKY